MQIHRQTDREIGSDRDKDIIKRKQREMNTDKEKCETQRNCALAKHV